MKPNNSLEQYQLTIQDLQHQEILIIAPVDMQALKLRLGDNVTSTAIDSADISLINGAAGTLQADKVLTADVNKHIDEVKATKLFLGGFGSSEEVTAKGSELNYLDGSYLILL